MHHTASPMSVSASQLHEAAVMKTTIHALASAIQSAITRTQVCGDVHGMLLTWHLCNRELLKDDIIPYAIKWFTGEAQDSDDEDDDEDDEDDDEDDEVCFDSQHHYQQPLCHVCLDADFRST